MKQEEILLEANRLIEEADEKQKNRYAYLKARLIEQKALRFMRDIINIVDAFNRITGRRCEYHTLGSLKLMVFWLKKGYTLPQFEGVFEFKHRMFREKHPEWVKIDTFCRRDKFENNLEDAREDYRKRKSQATPRVEQSIPTI